MDKIPTYIIHESGEDKQYNRSIGFYVRTFDANSGNVRIDDRMLVVNCTGKVDLPFRFTTHEKNGRHDIYLMYVTGGCMDMLVNGNESRVTVGDMVLFRPETEYRYTKTGQDDVKYLWVHFTGYDALALLERLGFGQMGIFHLGIDENISLLFLQLIEDFIIRDRYYEESAAGRLKNVLIAMRRRLDAIADGSSDSIGRIFKSIKFIHDNYKSAVTNEQLAGIEHLSISQYTELFKRCTGVTPRSYIIELRVRNACDLLRRSDLAVSQIAQSVGYDDAHYFSRIFKTYRGVSPDVYRRQEMNE